MSPDPAHCPQCGDPLAASLAGLCPRCVWSDSMTPGGGEGLIPGCDLGLEIARGGMGIVYAARQHSPDRPVAVKMLRPHLLEQVQMKERFRQEAQAAAALQHPGILPVYQVGEADGVPWFSMMLAEGGTLAARREHYHGQWRGTAQLMAHLARAVGHAHERGVLHRDLKPGNILFDKDDRAYVCDFGLAKVATAGESTPDWTLSVQLLGTPHYLPPEVAGGTQKQTTTAGDIYSLGVILYELLTGRVPFDANNVPALLRKIADEEPASLTSAARPLARRSGTGFQQPAAGSTTPGDVLEKVPAGPGDSEPVPERRVTGGWATGSPPADLAGVAMKCLEKNPARRYSTAAALADDLEAWLAGKPVTARRLSSLQKAGRWVRRNPAVAGLGFLLTASIATAFGVVAHKNRDLSSALDQRTMALRHSESISAFLTEAFRSPDPVRDGRNITVAETLDRAVSRVEREFGNQPAQRASLLATLGGTYAALGLHDKALPLLESVRDYHASTSAPDAPETIAALASLADSCGEAGRTIEALRLKQEVLTLCGRAGAGHPYTVTAMQKLSAGLYSAGKPGEAAALMEKVVPLRRRLQGPQHPGTFDAMAQLARCYEKTDRAPEALRIREEVLAFYRQATPPDPSRTVWALSHLADSCEQSSRQEDALRLREEAVTLGREKIGPEHSDTFDAIDRLASTWFETGQPEKALAVRVEVRGLYEKAFGREHPATFSARHALAASLAEAGRTEEALALWLEALPRLPGKFMDVPLMAGALQCWLGRIAEYTETCRLTLTASAGTREPEIADRAARLCCLWPGMNPQLLGQALEFARVAVETGAGHRDEAWFSTTLGMVLYRTGDFKAAEEALAAALRLAEQGPEARVHISGTARCYLCLSLFRQGRSLEAQAVLEQVTVSMKPVPSHPEQPLRERATLHDLILWLAFAEARDVLRGGGTL